jgi:hypothetical protein
VVRSSPEPWLTLERYGGGLAHAGKIYMPPLKICRITASDLLTIIEDVGFGKVSIGRADERGIVIDGYLDLAGIADRVTSLIEIRARSRQLIYGEQPR